MKPIYQLLRLFAISRTLIRHRIHEILLANSSFKHFLWLFWLLPWHWFRHPKQSRGKHIRLALEELGPIFIKFGQILSTRRDLLPIDVAEELARLQDQVPPFDKAHSRQIIEKAIGKPMAEVFSDFIAEPLGSASVAQVHAATLHNGDEVVIKVLRPDILPVIEHDLQLMYAFAWLVERFIPDGKRLRPLEVIRDYDKTIHDELDLQREAANASQMRRNTIDTGLIYVPKVYWDYCHTNVMVMERVYGVVPDNIDKLRDLGVDMKILSEKAVQVFFGQVFRDCFFHADMHPGNIFVDITHPEDPTWIAIDCGIVGTLNQHDQRYLADNFLAFFDRDYHRVAELHVESGWVPRDTSVEDFESAIRTVCEPIFERPLSEISFGHFLLRLFQTARRFNMEVQPQLVLLQKTLLNVEGLGRQLYPELDLWATAKPFLKDWMKTQVGPKALWNDVKKNAPYWLETLPELPRLIHEGLQQQRDGREQSQQQAQMLAQIAHSQRQQARSIWFTALGALLLVLAGMQVEDFNQLSLATVSSSSLFLSGLGSLSLLLAWPRKLAIKQ
ncbi:ubiquinone biosynthesis regulatory protein kinase UbiB [Pelagibaculum spongiae]|uniref:Probable protein kinase UbiB n=1 Tax=Pelagibaculum spongiae TaxID=2080658 RepID=A0A2V1GRX0_9GAMM|nr:ubiquinone biosynthesis regulatory protein kinase UbiB [Pelagibaculum spongiae]PVZ68139.1 ubiquinone biosynthesis regulatory protein kinase UbiB [Pelagibaculum spongiae]